MPSRNDLSEWLVHIHLFEGGLAQSSRVLEVVGLRSCEDRIVKLLDYLSLDLRPLAVVLSKREFVVPEVRYLFGADSNTQNDVGVSPGRQSSKPRDASSGLDCGLQTATDRRNVAQESDRVEKIRLPGSVRADQEDAALQIDLSVREVAPVLQAESGQP